MRLLNTVGGLAESPLAGSADQWNTEDVHGICFALGDADGSGWLGSRRVSVPAYSRADLHPMGAAPELGRAPGSRCWACAQPGLPPISAAEALEAGAGTTDRTGSEMAKPPRQCFFVVAD